MNGCLEHSGLAERIDRLAEDVAEIKGDVKGLVVARVLGRAFAAGAGVATPLAALAWALWGK